MRKKIIHVLKLLLLLGVVELIVVQITGQDRTGQGSIEQGI